MSGREVLIILAFALFSHNYYYTFTFYLHFYYYRQKIHGNLIGQFSYRNFQFTRKRAKVTIIHTNGGSGGEEFCLCAPEIVSFDFRVSGLEQSDANTQCKLQWTQGRLDALEFQPGIPGRARPAQSSIYTSTSAAYRPQKVVLCPSSY